MINNALIVVDCQNSFVDGELPVPRGEEAVQGISKYIKVSENNYSAIVATQDYHISPGDHFSDHPDYVDSWPRHCEAGTWGASFHPDLFMDFDCIFQKGQYSAAYSGFEGTHEGWTLHDYLEFMDVGRVDVVGLALEFCVFSTALDAAKLGYDTTVIVPLTGWMNDDGKVKSIEQLKAAGVKIVN